MKRLSCLLLFSIASSAYAVSDTAAVVGATAAQTAINSGMMVYWQSQGVQSNLVTTPTGMTYVVPVNNAASTSQSPPANPYQTQNDQQSKQDFFSN